MAHLLVVESWVGSDEPWLLPRRTREGGHRLTFLTRDLHHYLRSVEGTGPPAARGPAIARSPRTPTTPRPLPPRWRGCTEVFAFDGVLTSRHLPAGRDDLPDTSGLPGPGRRPV
ncbi:hypothetical protein LT493_10100 [Streptomyces tricolor]|nr:hypothetical protein [Streptomyces tricolor]